jgi:hypothetical protein
MIGYTDKIEECVLGLLAMHRLKNLEIGFTWQKEIPWAILINKYFRVKGDLLDCKEEMIAADLKQYARL